MKSLITISYAGTIEFLKELTNQLDKLNLMTKDETGSKDDVDGHSIKYFDYKKDLIFWAMIHSNQETYLIKANKELFETRENKIYFELPHFNLVLDQVARYEKGKESVSWEVIEEYTTIDDNHTECFKSEESAIKYFKKIEKDN
jgi:hypothetical protein